MDKHQEWRARQSRPPHDAVPEIKWVAIIYEDTLEGMIRSSMVPRRW